MSTSTRVRSGTFKKFTAYKLRLPKPTFDQSNSTFVEVETKRSIHQSTIHVSSTETNLIWRQFMPMSIKIWGRHNITYTCICASGKAFSRATLHSLNGLGVHCHRCLMLRCNQSCPPWAVRCGRMGALAHRHLWACHATDQNLRDSYDKHMMMMIKWRNPN